MPSNRARRDAPQARGLSDLKRLRAQAQAVSEAAPAPARPQKRQADATTSGTGKLDRATPSPDTPAAEQARAPSGVSPADIALFRRTVGRVAPIKAASRADIGPLPHDVPEVLRQRRMRATGDATEAPERKPHRPRHTPRDEKAGGSRRGGGNNTVSDHYHPASANDDRQFLQPGHGTDLIRGLRRGKWVIDASLDLHGCNLDKARERLDRFLQSCLEHHVRCVRIVHGKGHGSRTAEPILKNTVRRWLMQMDAIQAYVECAERDGGAGAVQVLLRPGE
ncbi:Smr/MutS family protein [Allopusillimonas soli]|uniref:Smr/MutS family protein n=1 Tax=Allopusillimonas soli TaxID=659016 RepID=A0A853FGT4_9BURK|nr:Smr/MutS family protein [Allopusillimonas soli]NYT38928.1 Smr/MutS family protein [Allopusillimonas soli]